MFAFLVSFLKSRHNNLKIFFLQNKEMFLGIPWFGSWFWKLFSCMHLACLCKTCVEFITGLIYDLAIFIRALKYTGLCHYIFEIEYMRGRKSQTRKLQYTMSKIKAFKKLPRSKVNSPLMIKFTGKNWNAAINFFSCHSVFRPNSTTPPFFSYILVFLYYSNHAGKKWMHHVTNMDGSRAKKSFLVVTVVVAPAKNKLLKCTIIKWNAATEEDPLLRKSLCLHKNT